MYFIAIFLGTSFLLFVPNEVKSDLGLLSVKEKYSTYIGSAWIVSLCVLISRLSWKIGILIQTKIKGIIRARKLKMRLTDLTPNEKKILKPYITKNTRTQTFNYTDGDVKELEENNIISQASTISSNATYFPYNIQSWAFDHLRKNRKLLE